MPGFSTLTHGRGQGRVVPKVAGRLGCHFQPLKDKTAKPALGSVSGGKHRKECPDLYPGEFVSAEFIVLDHRREFSKRPGLNWPTTFAYRLNEPAEPATP